MISGITLVQGNKYFTTVIENLDLYVFAENKDTVTEFSLSSHMLFPTMLGKYFLCKRPEYLNI